MPEETVDPGLLEQTKNQIRQLVSEIADLAEADIQPPEFHTEFLTRAVAAVAATGGALWLLDGRGGLKLNNQIEFRQTGLLDGRVRTQPHDMLLGCMVQSNQPQIIPPGATVEGVPNAGNPTPFALIIAPLIVDKQVIGLLEIMMDPSRRAATQKSTLRFVSDLTDLASQYHKNRQMRQVLSQQRLWNQLEGFTHAVHTSLDSKETAYAVANEGKRLIGVDRLSVALKITGRTMVEAVSGQEIVEQRSNLVREMTRLAKAVIHSGDDLVYTGSTESFPPEIRDALEIYVDESGAKAVIVTLLHKPEEDEKTKEKVPFGCLIAEQIGDELAPTDAQARAEVVARHASTALYNSSEYSRIFGRPLLKLIGSPWRFFRGRTFAKIVAVAGAIAAVILAMAFVPWELTIEGRGALNPEQRRILYAPSEARVAEVFVKHGDKVTKDQPLLQLESKELEKELRKVDGDYNEAENNLILLTAQIAENPKPDEKNRMEGEKREAEIRRETAGRMRDILKEQFDLLTVRAPFDGVIVYPFDLRRELLNRPVEVRTELLQIAATGGDWVEEVEVTDDDMGPVLQAKERLEAAKAAGLKPEDAALQAYFVSATDPEHRYHGHVLRIASKAEVKDGQNATKVTVAFPPEVREEFLKRNLELRPGAEVRVRIQCGKARLAYVLFRDVIHVWYETILFRWPFLTS
jgi:multidrug efflux pump subunit AcrA (membrane-fusion protein)